MAALDHILERHPVWRGGRLSASASATPTGFEALDRELPGGGWPRGTLTELLVGRAGIGELRLVLPALAALSWAGRRIAWLAPPHLPSAPALAAGGLAPGPPRPGAARARRAFLGGPANRMACATAPAVRAGARRRRHRPCAARAGACACAPRRALGGGAGAALRELPCARRLAAARALRRAAASRGRRRIEPRLGRAFPASRGRAGRLACRLAHGPGARIE